MTLGVYTFKGTHPFPKGFIPFAKRIILAEGNHLSFLTKILFLIFSISPPFVTAHLYVFFLKEQF